MRKRGEKKRRKHESINIQGTKYMYRRGKGEARILKWAVERDLGFADFRVARVAVAAV